MTGLEVVTCSAGVSVQDRGRTGFRRYGVSTAGAMDRRALAFANALVGNPADAAAIELTLLGATFRVVGAPLLVAVAGPGVTLAIDGRTTAPGLSARVVQGETVTVGPVRGGVFGYLAVSGGIQTEPVLASRSLLQRAAIGGRPLRAGDLVPCQPAGATAIPLHHDPPPPDPAAPFRLIPGPQDDHFTGQAMDTLLSEVYAVHPRSDRMGCRLTGPELAHRGGYNIVSDGVVPGSVQVPGNGQPIVLMRDCQTTGGYPKIATVISADLDRLAQMPPGAEVRFASATTVEAVSAARDLEAGLVRLAAAVRPARTAADTARLLSENLIGGVTDGREP